MSTREDSPSLRMFELAHVAKQYYVEGRAKTEIAEQLGISRFKVARLLEEAREEGIVRIEIVMPMTVDVELSEELQRFFEIEHAVVARTVDGSSAAIRGSVARVAAQMMEDLLEPGMAVGIGWGRTLNDLVDQLSEQLPACTTVQVVGSVPDAELWMNSTDIARRFAGRCGGALHTFLVPFVVDSPIIAESLRKEESVVRAREKFGSLDLVVAGIGSWDPPASGLYDLMSQEERQELLSAGATADILGTVISRDGDILPTSFTDRTIGISAEELRQVPATIAVAGGRDKEDAIAAALRSGLVSTLVTDSGVAVRLLRTTGSSPS